jgi:ABC-type Fe3+/spermidine/putrescine transport system ATPase subunit
MSTQDHPSRRNQHGHQVSVRRANKTYGNVRALTDINFDVEPGQFLVLLGPSGSGKSTLIRSLAGVERLDGGLVHLSGRLVSDRRQHLPPERRDLAMVFQDYALWPHMSVADNVGYALRRRRLTPRDHQQKVAAALDRVGLAGHASRYPSELSGGEQQRVALARAVVAEPGLLLFDEPLSNLDADLRERLRVEISTLTRDCGATAIYITHDQSEAFALADQIGVLDHGRLVQLAAPEDIYHRPATPFVARFTGMAGEMSGVVARRDHHSLEVRVGPATVLARPIGSAAPGDAVRILVRPAATTLSREGTVAGPFGDRNTLPGIVTDVAYRGRGYDHVVDCEGAGTLSSVHSAKAHGRGEKVQVHFDPQGCLGYRQDEALHERDISDLTAVRIASVA